jgi:hypothetical protein
MPPAKLLRVDGSQDRSAPFAPDISRRSNPKPRSTYRRSPKSTSRRCRGEVLQLTPPALPRCEKWNAWTSEGSALLLIKSVIKSKKGIARSHRDLTGSMHLSMHMHRSRQQSTRENLKAGTRDLAGPDRILLPDKSQKVPDIPRFADRPLVMAFDPGISRRIAWLIESSPHAGW